MRIANINRLIVVSSFYTKASLDYPDFYYNYIRPKIGETLDSMYAMEEFLFRKCPDIFFTIVRPPMLIDAPSNSRKIFRLLLIFKNKYLN